MMNKRTFMTLTATVLKLAACSSSSRTDEPAAGEPQSKKLQAVWEMPLDASTSADPKVNVTTSLKIEEKAATVVTTCTLEGASVTATAKSDLVLTDSDFVIAADKVDTQMLKVGDLEYPCSANVHHGLFPYHIEDEDKLTMIVNGKDVKAKKLK